MENFQPNMLFGPDKNANAGGAVVSTDVQISEFNQHELIVQAQNQELEAQKLADFMRTETSNPFWLMDPNSWASKSLSYTLLI